MTHVVRKLAPSSQRLKQLGQYAISPGHRGLAVTQNSPYSSLSVTLAIASTYGTYPQMDGQVELTWVAGYVLRQNFPAPGVERADTVTHPSTNRARRRITSLIETNALPLSQTATQED